MIAAPYPTSPRLGPLAPPSEEEAAEAYPELRDRAPTLAWAAVALGRQSSQLVQLARAGELLLVPAPWPVRQADDPGFLVPAWQLLPGGREPNPELPTLIAAAADAGWTSLRLDRFMTSPLGGEELTPAALLRAGGAARVAALIRGEPVARSAPPTTSRRRRHRGSAFRPSRRAARRAR